MRGTKGARALIATTAGELVTGISQLRCQCCDLAPRFRVVDDHLVICEKDHPQAGLSTAVKDRWKDICFDPQALEPEIIADRCRLCNCGCSG